MAYSAGTAYIQVLPSLRGFQRSTESQLVAPMAAAGTTAGTVAGARITEGATRGTRRLGSDIGTSVAAGIAARTDRVGTAVGSRINARLGTAISGTGERVGLAIGTGIETGMAAPLSRSVAATRTAGSRMYRVVSAPVRGIGALSAATFGAFGINAGAAFALAGGAAALMGVRTAAGLEQARIGFTTMLGSAKEANAFLTRMRDFAATTPFGFPELVDASQRMLAYGFTAREIIPTLRTLGDAAAGLGAGTEGVQSLVRSIGQMRSKGRVQTEEILQLTEVGIPALRILANQFGVTTTEMQEMVTAGEVRASKAIPKLLAGIRKGTKGAAGATTAFGGLMAKQADSLTGRWSNFVDVFQMRLADLVRPVLPGVKTGLSALTAALENPARAWRRFTRAIGGEGGGASPELAAFMNALGRVAGSIRDVLVPAFRQMWRLIRTQLLPAFEAFIPAIAPIATFFLRVFGAVIIGALKAVVSVIKGVLRIITGIINVFTGILTGDWRRAWKGVQQIVTGALQAIWGLLRLFLFSRFGAVFRAGGRMLRGLWSRLWGWISKLFTGAARGLISSVRAFLANLVRRLTGFRDWAGRMWSRLWNGLRQAVVNFAARILTQVLSWWHRLRSTFHTMRTVLGAIWNRTWTFIKRHTLIDEVARGIRAGLNRIQQGFRSAVEAIRRIWAGLRQAAMAPVRFVVNTVYNSGIRRAWNAVAGLVNLDKLPAYTMASGGTLAAGGKTTRPTAIVGEGSRTHPEYVIPTDPAHRGRARALYSQLGPQLMADGGILGGIGNAIGGAWNAITRFGGNVAEFFTNPGAALRSVVSRWLGLDIPGGGLLRQAMVQLPREMVAGLVDKVTDAFASMAAPIGPMPTGGAVTRWAPTVRQALAMLGQPFSLVPTVLRLIEKESGGNPRAINLWDVNARRGTPSMGLIQTIMPTFQAYAGPFAGSHPYNPLANIYAGLNYAISRYGSIAAVDPLVHAGGYDQGGTLPPGWSLAYNGTRRPERVLTDAQWTTLSAAASGSDGGYTVNIYPRQVDLNEANLRAFEHAAALRSRLGRPT